jgi:hypothetical protein
MPLDWGDVVGEVSHGDKRMQSGRQLHTIVFRGGLRRTIRLSRRGDALE